MSEVTDYDLVRSEIASFIGTPASMWDKRTASDVESSIRKGIDAVIHNSASHQWSWMRPIYRFKTSDGQRRYPLPIDFEQFIGDIIFDGDYYTYPPISQLPTGRLEQLRTSNNNTGIPTNYSLDVLSHDGTTQQNYQVALHPTPNSNYSLTCQYQVGPIRNLSPERPWFPGGPENKELFIASCLAAAESKFLDGPVTDKQMQFQNALVAAIGRDYRKLPRNLGQISGHRAHGRDYYRWKIGTTYLGNTDL